MAGNQGAEVAIEQRELSLRERQAQLIRDSVDETRGYIPKMERVFLPPPGQNPDLFLGCRLVGAWKRIVADVAPEFQERPGTVAANVWRAHIPEMSDEMACRRILERIFKGDRKAAMSLAGEVLTARGLEKKSVEFAVLPAMVKLQDVFLLIQEKVLLFFHKDLPKPESFVDRLTRRFKVSHEDLKAESLGRLWKEFLSFCNPEDTRWIADVSAKFDVGDIDSVACLLAATAKAFRGVEDDAAEAGQPIGFVRRKKFLARSEIVRLPKDEPMPILIYKGGKGRVVYYHGNDQEFIQSVKEGQGKERPLRELFEKDKGPLFAINLDVQDGLYQPEATKDAFELGTIKPCLVFHQAVNKNGENHLQVCADHLAFDGRFLQAMLTTVAETGIESAEGFYKELSGKKLVYKAAATEEEISVEDCGNTVVVSFARDPEVDKTRGGPNLTYKADLLNYATLFSLSILTRTQKGFEGELRKLDRSAHSLWAGILKEASLNFTITGGNVREPLSVGHCWLADAENIKEDSPFYNLRHTLALINCFNGYDYSVERCRRHKEDGTIPTMMRTMALLTEADLPNGVKRVILETNRKEALTPLRLVLFPLTAVTEGTRGWEHTTVAGGDLNCTMKRTEDRRIKVIMTRAKRNRLFPKEGFVDYVRWHCETMAAITSVVGVFGPEDSLEELNQRMEKVYQRQTEKLREVLQIPQKLEEARVKAGRKKRPFQKLSVAESQSLGV